MSQCRQSRPYGAFLAWLSFLIVTTSASAQVSPQAGSFCPATSTISPDWYDEVSSPVTFQWSQDPNSSDYHIIIEDAMTMLPVIDESGIVGLSKSYSLNPGMYYWYVHAVSGTCSEINTAPVGFTVLESCPNVAPTLQSPPNGAQGVTSPVAFSWSAVPDATSYQLFLSSNGGPQTSLGTTPDTSLTAPVQPGNHSWFVIARKPPNCGEQISPTFTFSTTVPVPARVESFEALPPLIRRGTATRLAWSTADATSVSIAPGIGSVDPDGSVDVAPESTTTYVLTATGTGGSVTANAIVEVFVDPEVALSGLPQPIVQQAGTSGGSTQFVLSNVGGTATTVSLSGTGGFFDQSLETFTLSPGASQVVTVTGRAMDPGAYRGTSIPQGTGVPSGLTVAIEMLVSEPPVTGTPIVEPVSKRIDVAGAPGTNPTGIAHFRNVGTARAEGFMTSRVPWVVPQPSLITIDPCGSSCDDPSTWAAISFTIDRAQRPDGETAIGSVSGFLEFVFAGGGSGKLGATPENSGPPSLVSIVDTSKPPTAPGQIPPLSPGENALFVPGVGHVVGSVGLFLSDVTIANLSGSGTLGDISMFYTPLGTGSVTSQSSTVTGVAATQPVALADVVKNVFENESQIGSLQLRSPSIRSVAVNANIFSVSNPRGTFGTTIPVLRSDRSAAAGQSYYLTGLRKSATAHTNLFIQETRGGSVDVDAQFVDVSGNVLGTKSYAVGPFQLSGDFFSATNPVLPDGAVTAILTARQGSSGAFSAYATPVDKASGDFWSVVDWNQQYQYDGTSPMIVPVAGRALGANNTFFRTDLAVVNRGGGTAVGSLRYYPREGGAPIDKTITLQANQSAVFDDVVQSLFGLDATVGYMVFTPQSGSFGVTSRTFSSEVGSEATFGTGVPTLSTGSSIRLGQTAKIGGVDDSALTTVTSGVPGSFRSNFALVETGGAPVTVRATLHYSFASAGLAARRGTAVKDFQLGASQFVLLSNVANQILGDDRAAFGDLTNLQIDFTIINGSGAASVFVSSVDNGTGDQILRTE